MPTQKNNRAAAKRFRFTRNGKIIRSQSNVRHLLSKKSSKRKRQLRGTTIIHPADKKAIALLLPMRIK